MTENVRTRIVRGANGRPAEEQKFMKFLYKGEEKELAVGVGKWFDEEGNIRQECHFTTATYKDRDGISFPGHGPYETRIFEQGKHVETETWVPSFGGPYNGPGSLFTFTLKHRVKHV